MWVIICILGDFWHKDAGWVDYEDATRYTEKEMIAAYTTMPRGGKWIPLDKALDHDYFD